MFHLNRIRNLEERVRLAEDYNRNLSQYLWDLVYILRDKGILPPVVPIGTAGDLSVTMSTAEPAVCGCRALWKGAELGRVIYHRENICPLFKKSPQTDNPTVGINDKA